MKKILFLSLFISFKMFGQSSTLIEPNGNNGIFSKNSTQVVSNPGTVALPASGAGTRLMWIPAKSAFRAGTVEGAKWDAENIGTWSFAGGADNIASGKVSTSFGFKNYSTGSYAFTAGFDNDASGQSSIALGQSATASGDYTLAIMGRATADNSIAIGNSVVAKTKYSIALGVLNDDSDFFSNTVTPTDRLFQLGNGESLGNRKNALTILRNAQMGVNLSTINLLSNEIMDINGRVRIRSVGNNLLNSAGIWFNNLANSINTNDGAFVGMENDTKVGFYIGGNWRFGVTNTGAMNAATGTFTGCVTASNLTCPSDFRYKKNIVSIQNSLDNILKITGVRYDWKKEEFPEKNFSNQPQIGFIAQDIEKIFPEMVSTDEKGYKSVDYARLTPVLVEALKELILKNQNLESRLDKIEAMLSTIQPNTENLNSKK